MTSKEYIESGILETYVMGMASEIEQKEVEMMAAANPDIRQEIDNISVAMEQYAMAHAKTPGSTIKPFVMAIIDYSERMKAGEAMSFPPVINQNSKLEEFATWLNRPDMDFPGSEEDNLSAKIIAYTPEMTTAIVWIKEESPWEIHDKELESFLIVEGSCNIIVGDKDNHLIAGDYFTIPLHEYHMVKVTSDVACKAILQRVAA
jgi:mannose-6-phosphate isomerase-like protein (cupin superfamily)